MKKCLAMLLVLLMLAGLFAVPAAATQPEQALPGITGVTWEGQRGWWACVDEAALAWADVFVPHQLEQYREFGAIIYRRFSWRNFRWGYTFSQTIRGEEYMVMPLPPPRLVWRPWRAVASVHTHPEGSSSYFSGQDLDAAHAWELLAHLSYVAGPDGTVRRYDSRTREFIIIRNNADPNVIVQLIEEYNLTHGGMGELIATVTGPQEVTITGEVTGVTRTLQFLHSHRYITIRFDATIEACSNYAPFALIEDFRRSGKIYIDGGVLSSENRGVFMWGRDSKLTITGGEVRSGISVERLNVIGGLVNIILPRQLDAAFVYICPKADFEVDWLNINIHANEDFTNFTVTDDVWVSRVIHLRTGDTLTIEEGASLDIGWGSIYLLGGTLVIDGELLGNVHAYRGTISGTNAGELAGTHGPWYDRLPSWLDFILRYMLFGFFWFRLF